MHDHLYLIKHLLRIITKSKRFTNSFKINERNNPNMLLKIILDINFKVKLNRVNYKITSKPSKIGCPMYRGLFLPAPLCAFLNDSDLVHEMKSSLLSQTE